MDWTILALMDALGSDPTQGITRSALQHGSMSKKAANALEHDIVSSSSVASDACSLPLERRHSLKGINLVIVIAIAVSYVGWIFEPYPTTDSLNFANFVSFSILLPIVTVLHISRPLDDSDDSTNIKDVCLLQAQAKKSDTCFVPGTSILVPPTLHSTSPAPQALAATQLVEYTPSNADLETLSTNRAPLRPGILRGHHHYKQNRAHTTMQEQVRSFVTAKFESYMQPYNDMKPNEYLVCRSGRFFPCTVESIVTGDLLFLRVGDTIPVDALMLPAVVAHIADPAHFGYKTLHTSPRKNSLLSPAQPFFDAAGSYALSSEQPEVLLRFSQSLLQRLLYRSVTKSSTQSSGQYLKPFDALEPNERQLFADITQSATAKTFLQLDDWLMRGSQSQHCNRYNLLSANSSGVSGSNKVDSITGSMSRETSSLNMKSLAGFNQLSLLNNSSALPAGYCVHAVANPTPLLMSHFNFPHLKTLFSSQYGNNDPPDLDTFNFEEECISALASLFRTDKSTLLQCGVKIAEGVTALIVGEGEQTCLAAAYSSRDQHNLAFKLPDCFFQQQSSEFTDVDSNFIDDCACAQPIIASSMVLQEVSMEEADSQLSNPREDDSSNPLFRNQLSLQKPGYKNGVSTQPNVLHTQIPGKTAELFNKCKYTIPAVFFSHLSDMERILHVIHPIAYLSAILLILEPHVPRLLIQSDYVDAFAKAMAIQSHSIAFIIFNGAIPCLMAALALALACTAFLRPALTLLRPIIKSAGRYATALNGKGIRVNNLGALEALGFTNTIVVDESVLFSNRKRLQKTTVGLSTDTHCITFSASTIRQHAHLFSSVAEHPFQLTADGESQAAWLQFLRFLMAVSLDPCTLRKILSRQINKGNIYESTYLCLMETRPAENADKSIGSYQQQAADASELSSECSDALIFTHRRLIRRAPKSHESCQNVFSKAESLFTLPRNEETVGTESSNDALPYSTSTWHHRTLAGLVDGHYLDLCHLVTPSCLQRTDISVQQLHPLFFPVGTFAFLSKLKAGLYLFTLRTDNIQLILDSCGYIVDTSQCFTNHTSKELASSLTTNTSRFLFPSTSSVLYRPMSEADKRQAHVLNKRNVSEHSLTYYYAVCTAYDKTDQAFEDAIPPDMCERIHENMDILLNNYSAYPGFFSSTASGNGSFKAVWDALQQKALVYVACTNFSDVPSKDSLSLVKDIRRHGADLGLHLVLSTTKTEQAVPTLLRTLSLRPFDFARYKARRQAPLTRDSDDGQTDNDICLRTSSFDNILLHQHEAGPLASTLHSRNVPLANVCRRLSGCIVTRNLDLVSKTVLLCAQREKTNVLLEKSKHFTLAKQIRKLKNKAAVHRLNIPPHALLRQSSNKASHISTPRDSELQRVSGEEYHGYESTATCPIHADASHSCATCESEYCTVNSTNRLVRNAQNHAHNSASGSDSTGLCSNINLPYSGSESDHVSSGSSVSGLLSPAVKYLFKRMTPKPMKTLTQLLHHKRARQNRGRVLLPSIFVVPDSSIVGTSVTLSRKGLFVSAILSTRQNLAGFVTTFSGLVHTNITGSILLPEALQPKDPPGEEDIVLKHCLRSLRRYYVSFAALPPLLPSPTSSRILPTSPDLIRISSIENASSCHRIRRALSYICGRCTTSMEGSTQAKIRRPDLLLVNYNDTPLASESSISSATLAPHSLPGLKCINKLLFGSQPEMQRAGSEPRPPSEDCLIGALSLQTILSQYKGRVSYVYISGRMGLTTFMNAIREVPFGFASLSSVFLGTIRSRLLISLLPLYLLIAQMILGFGSSSLGANNDLIKNMPIKPFFFPPCCCGIILFVTVVYLEVILPRLTWVGYSQSPESALRVRQQWWFLQYIFNPHAKAVRMVKCKLSLLCGRMCGRRGRGSSDHNIAHIFPAFSNDHSIEANNGMQASSSKGKRRLHSTVPKEPIVPLTKYKGNRAATLYEFNRILPRKTSTKALVMTVFLAMLWTVMCILSASKYLITPSNVYSVFYESEFIDHDLLKFSPFVSIVLTMFHQAFTSSTILVSIRMPLTMVWGIPPSARIKSRKVIAFLAIQFLSAIICFYLPSKYSWLSESILGFASTGTTSTFWCSLPITMCVMLLITIFLILEQLLVVRT